MSCQNETYEANDKKNKYCKTVFILIIFLKRKNRRKRKINAHLQTFKKVTMYIFLSVVISK